MKKIFLTGIAVVLVNVILSQSPLSISFRSILRNADDQLVANSSIGVQFSIIQGSLNGTAIYVETQFLTSNNIGLISTDIGSGTVVSGSLVDIDWSNGPFFLKTETDLLGGSNYNISGTKELLSVPYAQHANSASSAINNYDKDSLNETQFLSVSNDTVFLSEGGLSILPAEVDGSVTNELQTLSMSNDSLFIHRGNSVYLGLLRDNDWVENGNYTYNDADSIGIGTNSPDATLDLNGSFQLTDGNEARGKLLMSDSLGNASWDSLTHPYQITSTSGIVQATWTNGDVVVTSINISLSKRSLVIATFSSSLGSGTNPSGTYTAGIAFPGEALYHNTGTKVYQSLRGSCTGSPIPARPTPISNTRSKLLDPGVHLIRIELASISNNLTVARLHETTLIVTVIPLN